jgi:hypothetical protein
VKFKATDTATTAGSHKVTSNDHHEQQQQQKVHLVASHYTRSSGEVNKGAKAERRKLLG